MNFFEGLIEHPSFHRLGLTLVHFVWQGVAVGALSGLALFLLRRRSANSRYCGAVVALVAMAVLPIGTFCVLDAPVATDQAESAFMRAPDGFELLPSRASEVASAAKGDTAISFDERPHSWPFDDASRRGRNQTAVETGSADQSQSAASV